jgi:hypothetical protein
MYKKWSNGFIRIFILANLLGAISITTSYYSSNTIQPSFNWSSPVLNISIVKWLFLPLFLAFTYYIGNTFVTIKLNFNLNKYQNLFLSFIIGFLLDILLSVAFLVVLYVLREITKLIYFTS